MQGRYLVTVGVSKKTSGRWKKKKKESGEKKGNCVCGRFKRNCLRVGDKGGINQQTRGEKEERKPEGKQNPGGGR